MIVEGPPNAPVPSWTKLGWTLHDKVKQLVGRVDLDITVTVFEKERAIQDLVKSIE